MITPLLYIAAALAEIAGCFSVWAWWRLEKTPLWLVPGLVSLALFAWLLSLVDTDYAGRAYAAGELRRDVVAHAPPLLS